MMRLGEGGGQARLFSMQGAGGSGEGDYVG